MQALTRHRGIDKVQRPWCWCDTGYGVDATQAEALTWYRGQGGGWRNVGGTREGTMKGCEQRQNDKNKNKTYITSGAVTAALTQAQGGCWTQAYFCHSLWRTTRGLGHRDQNPSHHRRSGRQRSPEAGWKMPGGRVGTGRNGMGQRESWEWHSKTRVSNSRIKKDSLIWRGRSIDGVQRLGCKRKTYLLWCRRGCEWRA